MPMWQCENAAHAAYEQQLNSCSATVVVAAAPLAVVTCILSGHSTSAIDFKLIADMLQHQLKLKDCL